MIAVSGYAALSYDSYNASQNNWVILPSGWVRDNPLTSGGNGNPGNLPEDSLFGFGAAVYRNENSSEVVIAFRGTETTLLRGIRDASADVLAGLFAGSPQLMEAIDLYIEVRKAFPDAEISLTGHSLGGGLASMLAILFGHEAVTFAQAPFESSIINPVVLGIARERVQKAIDDSNGALNRTMFGELFSASRPSYSELQARVTSHTVTGEFLSSKPWIVDLLTTQCVGKMVTYDVGNIDGQMDGISKHSIDLHLACVLSPDFVEACRTVPEFLGRIFSGDYYPTDKRDEDQTFLAVLNNRHVQETGYALGALGALDRLAVDINRLAGLADTSGLDGRLADGLCELLAQFHFEQADDGKSGLLFSDVGGGISFDLSSLASSNPSDILIRP